VVVNYWSAFGEASVIQTGTAISDPLRKACDAGWGGIYRWVAPYPWRRGRLFRRPSL